MAVLAAFLALGLAVPADARSAAAIVQDGTLRVGVNPNFPPMSSYGDDNELEGFDVDVARAIARAMGVRLELVPTEAAQRVPFLTTGRIDMSLGALTHTPEREELIDFTVPLHSEAMGVITTSRLPVSSWRELNRPDVTIVNMRGNQSVSMLEETLPRPRRLLVDGNADTIRAIAQGRADALVENVDFFIGFTENYPDVDWRILSEPIFVAYCAIGIAEGNVSLQNYLDGILYELHSEGRIAELWEKWYGAPMTVPIEPRQYAEAAEMVGGPITGKSTSHGGGYRFDFSAVFAELPYLLVGALISLQIAFISFWAGAIIGTFGAIGKVYGGEFSRRIVGGYVTFFTNTPALVQIFLLFYALPDAGVMLSPMTAVLIGLVLNSGAYLTEIIRGGVVSVRKAEMEAAQTLGMTRWHVLRFVMLPHIVRTVYAPLSNFFIWLVLGSSIAALFGVEELTGRAINISTANLRTIETFTVVAVIYVALTLIASVSLALLGRYAFRVKMRLLQ
ncbi:MAG: ABC transporter substrate-binding protein/permease [Parasphingopyxis sp.]|uniref:ABC transporter substrate-binding protein/permease n=1 Tax=Parasphingopyxis sp. TaxID=1920299 RepID=UPI003F9EE4F2